VDADRAPAPIRAAALLIALEVLALLAAAGVLVFKTATGHPEDAGGALIGALMAVAGALVLAMSARGLIHLHAAARAPVIVLQLLALPVAYSLAFQAGRVVYGGPILLVALAVLYLLFTPPARAVLDRQRNG
jgi:hypothetical protein